MHYVSWEEMASGHTMGRRQGTVMLSVVFFCRTLGPSIYVDSTLACIIYLNEAAD